MAFGRGPAGVSQGGGPSAPTHRPPWLLVLSSITLVYGGLLLVSGLSALRDPAAAAKFQVTRPLAPTEEALTRELIDLNATVVARHVGAIRGRAGASTVLALLMLYSAAAALSRDRRGRTVTLAVAWLGIVYQLGSLPLVIPIAQDYAAASAPILARMVAADTPAPAGAIADASAIGGASATGDAGAAGDAGAMAPTATAVPPPTTDDAPTRPETLVGMMHTLFVGIPIATALLGIIGSLLLIIYFGGRRGRALYGLPPRSSRR